MLNERETASRLFTRHHETNAHGGEEARVAVGGT
jgi:hypothetical protein